MTGGDGPPVHIESEPDGHRSGHPQGSSRRPGRQRYPSGRHQGHVRRAGRHCRRHRQGAAASHGARQRTHHYPWQRPGRGKDSHAAGDCPRPGGAHAARHLRRPQPGRHRLPSHAGAGKRASRGRQPAPRGVPVDPGRGGPRRSRVRQFHQADRLLLRRGGSPRPRRGDGVADAARRRPRLAPRRAVANAPSHRRHLAHSGVGEARGGGHRGRRRRHPRGARAEGRAPRPAGRHRQGPHVGPHGERAGHRRHDDSHRRPARRPPLRDVSSA